MTTQKYTWLAKLDKGEQLKEFNLDKTTNNFGMVMSAVAKGKMLNFGLEREDGVFYNFNLSDQVLEINGRRLKLLFETNNITNVQINKVIPFQLKRASIDFNTESGIPQQKFISYNFGYNAIAIANNISLKHRVEYCVSDSDETLNILNIKVQTSAPANTIVRIKDLNTNEFIYHNILTFDNNSVCDLSVNISAVKE